jgi:hypothetical protein
MAGIAAARNLGDLRMPRNAVMDVTSGVVGATTMVLPGISGSYMLLILDQYDRVVGAVADLKDGSWSALAVIIPVGIGAVIGVVGLSNLLKWLLHRHEQVTLGFLLGMLLGSVIGLWPFSQPPTEKILQRASDQKLHEYAAREGIAGAENADRRRPGRAYRATLAAAHRARLRPCEARASGDRPCGWTRGHVPHRPVGGPVNGNRSP